MTLTPRIDRLVQNQLINGGMDYWQRGTTFTSVANNAYSADRFKYRKSGSMVNSIAQSTDVPTFAQAGHQFRYSMSITVGTASASPGAGDYAAISYLMEGQDYARIHGGKSVRYQLWVKSNKAGNYSVTATNSAIDRCYVSSFNISSAEAIANTWVKKFVDFTTDTTGTWNFDHTVGMQLWIMLTTGATYQTSPGSWVGGSFLGATGGVNFNDSTSNTLKITGLMLAEIDSTMVGSTDVDLNFRRIGRSFSDELSMCERYYEKSYNLTDNPGTNTFSGVIYLPLTAYNQGYDGGIQTFKVRKRVDPTVTVYARQGTQSAVEGLDNNVTRAANSGVATFLGQTSFSVRNNSGGNLSSVAGFCCHYVADAEL